jgi:D-arabinose 1-dehydrogenase-like Zn-dependent alcohol dehydrogenase
MRSRRPAPEGAPSSSSEGPFSELGPGSTSFRAVRRGQEFLNNDCAAVVGAGDLAQFAIQYLKSPSMRHLCTTALPNS